MIDRRTRILAGFMVAAAAWALWGPGALRSLSVLESSPDAGDAARLAGDSLAIASRGPSSSVTAVTGSAATTSADAPSAERSRVAPVGSGSGGGTSSPAASRTGADGAVPGSLARRPGGSDLYDGTRRARSVPQGLSGASALEIKAAQLERDSDVADKRGTIVGEIDAVSATAISGWAYSWNDSEQPAGVDVFVDGVLVGSVLSVGARAGFVSADPTNPVDARAWTCPAPPVLADGDKHVVEAFGYKPGTPARQVLVNSPFAFGGVSIPTGKLVWVGPNLAYGWAVDPANPQAPVRVSILGDGQLLGTVQTLGAGHNDEVFQKAVALSPSARSVVLLPGPDGSDAAVNAQATTLAQAGHYSGMIALASAVQGSLAFDELDFFTPAPTEGSAPLAVAQRAAVKFSPVDGDVQAFLFQTSAPIGATWIQARVSNADGSLEREMKGSPQPLGTTTNRLPIGAVFLVSNSQVSGWAYDPDVLPAPIDVDVLVDGVYVARIPADKTFAALPGAVTALQEPNHAFVFTPPDQYLDGKTHSIQFRAVNQPEGVNPEIGGSPTTFVGKRNAPPSGTFDSVDTQTANGWAYDPDAGASPTQVEVWIDNALFQQVPANGVRPDLVPIVAPEAEHGFSVALPDAVRDGKAHTIRVFALNFPDGPKQELNGSPRDLNGQAPFIGIYPDDTDPTGSHLYRIGSGTGAEAAGLVVDDVIRAFDGRDQRVDASALIAWCRTKEVGEKVLFKVWHDPAKGSPAVPPAAVADPGVGTTGPGERFVVATVGSR